MCCSKKELEEIKRRLGYLQGSFVKVSDFLAVRSMVSIHDPEIISLREATISTPAPSPLQEPTRKLSLSLYSSNRRTLPNFL